MIQPDASALDVRDLVVRFGKTTVLDRLSLSIPANTLTVLLGQNGAGKTTLLRAALGLARPTAGTVTIAGHDPMRQPAATRRAVGYVPSRPDALPWMTLQHLFDFLAPQHPGFDHAAALTLADRLSVPTDRAFSALSRGQAMKAMLVAAVAPRPPIVLLDEPFAGLDPIARDDVLSSVIDALRTDECTVVLTTHDLDVAARAADRIAILAGGRIAAEGPVEEVLGGDDDEGRLPRRIKDAMTRHAVEEVAR